MFIYCSFPKLTEIDAILVLKMKLQSSFINTYIHLHMRTCTIHFSNLHKKIKYNDNGLGKHHQHTLQIAFTCYDSTFSWTVEPPRRSLHS